jgi:Transposase DDE domain
VARLLRRLEAPGLEPIVSAAVQRLMPQPRPQATVAVEATGLAPGAMRPCVVKRANARGAGFTWRHWRKWTMAVDIDHRVILAQTARRGPTDDGAPWRPLLDVAPRQAPMALGRADAECDRERTQQHMRHSLQAQSVMPAKRGGADRRMQGGRAQMRQEFPAHLYRRRARSERIISAVKRQRSARAPGRSLQTPCLQAWLLGIAYNLDRLWCFVLLGFLKMSTEPNCLQSGELPRLPIDCRGYEHSRTVSD